ncbi:hypothetical protein OSB04_013297 [Centaurea solstitialis]|uniref:NB-ARC domain-containing protein n=1 Tax=Centaurea solstitialis TaxID=347529 RepID=A0AA38TXQ3_9ASTR|nr:hypothetical protein OSB04_013297 [Centaurea solstitialis]
MRPYRHGHQLFLEYDVRMYGTGTPRGVLQDWTFTEADLDRIHLEDLLTLIKYLQGPILRPEHYRDGTEILKKYVRHAITLARVTDYQLAIESRQPKVNLLRPNLLVPGIDAYLPYMPTRIPEHGVLYVTMKKRERRFMRFSELAKFCDGTLLYVFNGMQSRLLADQVPSRKFVDGKGKILEAMNLIERKLKERLMYRRVEAAMQMRARIIGEWEEFLQMSKQETKFIDEIVKDIYQRLGVLLKATMPLLYGMESDVSTITSWLKDGSSHTVDILTILGLSGIGKTTLARHVHEAHRYLFDRSSFIKGVNEKCSRQVDGLLDLQKQLAQDISKTSPIQIHDVLQYTSLIENILAHQKVFIVLDDISSLEQLDALLGKKGFHPGSKIIVTTKELSLTEKYVSVLQPKLTKLFLEGLDKEASLQLLSHHAFKGNGPKESYGEVSEKLIVYCQGHPLALKVLGEVLYERDVAEWKECIQGLKEEPISRIQKAMQMSFDSLPQNNDKELFKHIACFFVGEDRDYTEIILKACGIRTLHGITNLIDRCLLTIGRQDEVQMHQLLQEMGRYVVRQESPDKPWKRSRLWCHEDSFKVLEQKKGSGKVKGLNLDMELLEKEKSCGPVELTTDALSKMYNLVLLKLNYVQLNGSYNNFPRNLKWLCMRGSPLKSIPLDLQMKNLVALDMSYSNLEFFVLTYGNLQQTRKMQSVTGSSSKDKRLLRSLKILNLSFCKQLCSIGGFFEIPALEWLILENCGSLIEVCESIEHCDELFLIDLSYCNMLKKLPRNVAKLTKVEMLSLDGLELGEFSIEMRDMELFEKHKANNICINSQASSSALRKTMGRLLESSLFPLPSALVKLSLENCKLSDSSFLMDFNCLSNLKDLYLDGNPNRFHAWLCKKPLQARDA